MRHWYGEAKRKEHKRVSTSLQEEPKHGDAGKREASEGMRVRRAPPISLVRYVRHAQGLSHLKVRDQKRTRASEKVRWEREGHAWRHGP